MAKNVELSGLTSRQKKMIAALLTSENIGQACELARVSRTTLARWLKDPQFMKELTKAEGESIKQASRELLAGQAEALATIREIMGSGQPATRLKAANDWLALLFKYREVDQLEERISRLEERIK
jgi:hypothetical protein